MKYLNKKTTKIFNSLVGNKKYQKIENGSFMPLSIEYLYSVDTAGMKGKVYSFAHYYEQEGDLMADPEVCFLSVRDGEYIIPMSFKNAGLGIDNEYVILKDKQLLVQKRMQADLKDFSNQWMENLKDQGFLSAKELQTA